MTDIAPIIKEFNEFWTSLHVDEVAFPNRKAATLGQWRARTPAARKAMKEYVEQNGPPPKKKNPFFFVQDFPEPIPTDYNGKAAIEKLLPKTPLVCAEYKGSHGVYKLEEALMHNMDMKRGVNFNLKVYQETGIINLIKFE